MRTINRGARSRAYVGAAVVLIGFVLSACGTEVTPTSGASDATPDVAPTVPRGAMPSAPATAAFQDRARAVAEAVRAAGIPKPPEGIFLHSSRTPGLAFDTTEQKLAWSAGKVVVASGVRLGSGGTSRIDFADGSSLLVSVVDARPALTGEIGTTQSNCRNLPASSCTLTITAASLGTTEVVTSRGPATVPAWSFTAKGLSRKIVVVAVSKDVLKTPAVPVPPPGLAQPEPGLVQGESLTRVEGSTLTFFLYHGDCDRDLRAHVLEFDDLVVIGGSHDQPQPGTACTSALRRTGAVITLAAPLGDRAVISASTGVRLFLNPHVK
jgi:hypothetical protein